MGRTDLAAVLERKPFEPFRIITSDGTSYDVHHPHMVMVGFTSAHIGYPDAASPKLFLKIDIVALEHIVRLEELQPTPAKPADQ